MKLPSRSWGVFFGYKQKNKLGASGCRYTSRQEYGGVCRLTKIAKERATSKNIQSKQTIIPNEFASCPNRTCKLIKRRGFCQAEDLIFNIGTA